MHQNSRIRSIHRFVNIPTNLGEVVNHVDTSSIREVDFDMLYTSLCRLNPLVVNAIVCNDGEYVRNGWSEMAIAAVQIGSSSPDVANVQFGNHEVRIWRS